MDNANDGASRSNGNDADIGDEIMSPRDLVATMSNNNNNSNYETEHNNAALESIFRTRASYNDENSKRSHVAHDSAILEKIQDDSSDTRNFSQ